MVTARLAEVGSVVDCALSATKSKPADKMVFDASLQSSASPQPLRGSSLACALMAATINRSGLLDISITHPAPAVFE
jgi:hypothetical protein